MKNLLLRYELSLDGPAYNFALHTAPPQESSLDYYHWHIEFIPKLTSMAGFEWGTGFYINPTPPEESARFLRETVVPGEVQRVR
jgi:UDPglucose--hexose-1-phosphate uridylyltransferase